MRRQIFAVILFTLLVLTSNAFAIDPLHRDSAFTMQDTKASMFALSTLTEEQQAIFTPVAVELVCAYGGKHSDWSVTPEIDLTAVFLKNIEVTLALPYMFSKSNTSSGVERENGFSDIEIDAKWKFFDKKKYAIALLSALILPTGNEDKGLGDGSTSIMVGSAVSLKATDDLTVSGQVGFQSNNNNIKDFMSYGINGKYDISEKLSVFGKVKGHTSAVKNSDDNTIVGTLGADYSYLKEKGQDSKYWEIIVSGSRRLTTSGPDYLVIADLAYNF